MGNIIDVWRAILLTEGSGRIYKGRNVRVQKECNTTQLLCYHSLLEKDSSVLEQDRQSAYNVISRRVRVTIFAVEKE
jgi:hypothetical protein